MSSLGSIAATYFPPPASAAPAAGLSLREIAQKRGITYGTELTLPMLRFDKISEIIIHEAAMITPGVEMKWGVTEKTQGVRYYGAADTISNFAQSNKLMLRGHTALWYRNLPKWVPPLLENSSGMALLVDHVTDIVRHFKGKIVEWDVVNEVIEPNDNLPGGMRNWPPFAGGDVGYIAESFHAAANADPAALLFYNDYGFIYDPERSTSRKTAALNLIEQLKKRGVPIHGFGFQCHLRAGVSFDANGLRRFLADIAALDMRISLTELDVSDARLPRDIPVRDKAVADHAYEFLSVALEEPAVKRLLTWGITDRFTWLNTKDVRKGDGASRPLPYDEDLNRKPLWDAIARALNNAPQR